MNRTSLMSVICTGVLALLAPAIAQATPYHLTVLDDNPLAYYRFSETSGTVAADSAGDADGEYQNVALGQPGPRPPQFSGFESTNTAGGFNGSSSYVDLEVQIYDQLESSAPSAITLETWVNRNDFTGLQTLVASPISNSASGFELLINDGTTPMADPAAAGTLRMAGRSSSTDGYNRVDTSMVLPTGEWLHLVGILDFPGDEIRIYVNGQLAASGAANFGSNTYDPGTITANDRIGQAPGGGVYFNGLLDEIAIYAYALDDPNLNGDFSDSRVMAHFLAAQPVPEPATALLIALGSLLMAYSVRRRRGI